MKRIGIIDQSEENITWVMKVCSSWSATLYSKLYSALVLMSAAELEDAPELEVDEENPEAKPVEEETEGALRPARAAATALSISGWSADTTSVTTCNKGYQDNMRGITL